MHHTKLPIPPQDLIFGQIGYELSCAIEWDLWLESATPETEPVGIGRAEEWSQAHAQDEHDRERGA